MTLPRTVADVLRDHVSFEVECIDRMYLNVYVPQLQYATGLVSCIHRQLGKPVAPTAALAPVSEAFTRSVRAFAAGGGIPWVDFAKGQRKDDVAGEFLAGFTGTWGCCSSAGRRRRSRCSGPASAAGPTAAPTRGSRRRPGWSTSTTSIASMRTSARMPTARLCRTGFLCAGHSGFRGSSAAFPRGGVSGSQGVEEGQEAVGRRVSSFRGASGCQPCERLFLELHVGVQVDACGGRRLVPEPQGDDGDVDACVQQ